MAWLPSHTRMKRNEAADEVGREVGQGYTLELALP